MPNFVCGRGEHEQTTVALTRIKVVGDSSVGPNRGRLACGTPRRKAGGQQIPTGRSLPVQHFAGNEGSGPCAVHEAVQRVPCHALAGRNRLIQWHRAVQRDRKVLDQFGQLYPIGQRTSPLVQQGALQPCSQQRRCLHCGWEDPTRRSGEDLLAQAFGPLLDLVGSECSDGLWEIEGSG